MVSYAAPKKNAKVLPSMRYLVTRARVTQAQELKSGCIVRSPVASLCGSPPPVFL